MKYTNTPEGFIWKKKPVKEVAIVPTPEEYGKTYKYPGSTNVTLFKPVVTGDVSVEKPSQLGREAYIGRIKALEHLLCVSNFTQFLSLVEATDFSRKCFSQATPGKQNDLEVVLQNLFKVILEIGSSSPKEDDGTYNTHRYNLIEALFKSGGGGKSRGGQLEIILEPALKEKDMKLISLVVQYHGAEIFYTTVCISGKGGLRTTTLHEELQKTKEGKSFLEDYSFIVKAPTQSESCIAQDAFLKFLGHPNSTLGAFPRNFSFFLNPRIFSVQGVGKSKLFSPEALGRFGYNKGTEQIQVYNTILQGWDTLQELFSDCSMPKAVNNIIISYHTAHAENFFVDIENYRKEVNKGSREL